MSKPREFDLDTVRELLIELGARLRAKGITGDIRVVGGAAVMFTGSHRRTTSDVDASYAPKAAVDAVVAEMAQERSLPATWLNDRAAAFLPDGATWIEVPLPEMPEVSMADDRTLLAMKVAAERDRDMADIAYLAAKLGLSTPAQIVDLAFDVYGEHSIPLSGTRENYLIVAEEALAAGPPNNRR